MTNQRFFMAVNVLSRQLALPAFVEDVRAVIARHRIDPRSLVIEITESAVMADPEASLLRLHGLKALGVDLAIDDFGRGYSSLNYLCRFPVDVLKIDKSFVDSSEERSQKTRMLVETVLGLARGLGLHVVTEGIDRAGQLEVLAALGCPEG